MVFMKLAKMYFKPAGFIKYAPYLLIVPIIVFQALSLTGCVSTAPAIPNIYVVTLRSSSNTSAENPLQVRIGYFGICGIDEDGTRCQSASGRSIDTLATNLFPEQFPPANTTKDTKDTKKSDKPTPAQSEITDLLTTALDLQKKTFISILAVGAVLFSLSLILLILFKRDVSSPTAWDHPRRSTIIRRSTYAALYGSIALVFASALATTQSAGALEYASVAMRDASVLIKSGTTMQVLQWLVFGFEAAFGLAVPFLLVRPQAAVEGEYKGEV